MSPQQTEKQNKKNKVILVQKGRIINPVFKIYWNTNVKYEGYNTKQKVLILCNVAI